MNPREPLNTLTHLIGVVLSLIGSFLLLLRVENLWSIEGLSAIIFLLGLLLLYGASSFYHAYQGPASHISILRILDHSMIYVLIAATYTPIALVGLNSMLGNILLSCIWLSAFMGIILRISVVNVPRWVYTSIYLVLGWSALIVIYPLSKALPIMALVYLFLGGIAYTVGAVIYGRKSESFKMGPWGFHEIFHLFILLGSLLHFIMIYTYIYG